jgi:predicted PurR-regulated permease PerM
MKSEKESSLVFGMILIFGIMLVVSISASDSAYGQTNSTLNQGQTNSTLNQGQTNSTLNQTSIPTSAPTTTTSAQKEASESIKGAITETGEFVGNVTQKIITSKSAGTILNETSEVLGDAYIEVKKYFSP